MFKATWNAMNRELGTRKSLPSNGGFSGRGVGVEGTVRVGCVGCVAVGPDESADVNGVGIVQPQAGFCSAAAVRYDLKTTQGWDGCSQS